MSTTGKPKPPRRADDNPEWTKADITKARPATELLVRLTGASATEALLKRSRGRPLQLHRKVNQTLRLDEDVLAAFRQTGKGWQTRMNEVLRRHMPKSKTSRVTGKRQIVNGSLPAFPTFLQAGWVRRSITSLDSVERSAPARFIEEETPGRDQVNPVQGAVTLIRLAKSFQLDRNETFQDRKL